MLSINNVVVSRDAGDGAEAYADGAHGRWITAVIDDKVRRFHQMIPGYGVALPLLAKPALVTKTAVDMGILGPSCVDICAARGVTCGAVVLRANGVVAERHCPPQSTPLPGCGWLSESRTEPSQPQAVADDEH